MELFTFLFKDKHLIVLRVHLLILTGSSFLFKRDIFVYFKTYPGFRRNTAYDFSIIEPARSF